MSNIDRLYDSLYRLYPIPLEFKESLKPLIEEKRFKNLKRLLKNDKKATRAWHILSGCIIAVEGSPRHQCVVKKIYYPDEITTDLKSFFENVNSNYSLYGVGNLIIQEIKKKNFEKLCNYPETDELVKRILIRDSDRAMNRADLIAIQDPGKRVRAFLQEHPAIGLPNKLAASFLAMNEEKYIEEKCLIVEESIEFGKSSSKFDPKPKEIAYRCKIFLINHLASRDIGTTEQIAAKLFTTAKTLTRTMKKTFGLTTREYLTKLRMEKALELLMQKLPVNQVAILVGYSDMPTFSKTYKKYFNHSPKETLKYFN